MRFLLEMIVVAALIWVGWETPFRERMPGYQPPTPAAVHQVRPRQRPTPAPRGAWMWDPNRRTALDTPHPNVRSVTPTPGDHSGAWMWENRGPLDQKTRNQTIHRDQEGRVYWVDVWGKRHYKN